MADVVMIRERFDIGRVIGRTFGAIGRNFGAFLLLSILLAGVPAVIVGWVQTALTSFPQSGDFVVVSNPLVFPASVLVSVAATYILNGALTHGSVEDFSGRRANFGSCLSTGIRFFLPLLVIAIVSSIAIGIGLILLIVPGVILAVMWIVVVPAAVVEKTGIGGAFVRSADLTKGCRWSVFGVALIYFVATILISAVLGVPTGLLIVSTSPEIAIFLLNVVLTPIQSVLFAIVGGAGVASIYYELRHIKEGVEAEALAAVFD